jgi:D-3-phosphoglycerate dehydrogenase
VVRQATTAVKNLILAMNGEKPIAQVNPEVMQSARTVRGI